MVQRERERALSDRWARKWVQRERERERERALTAKMRKKNWLGSERERERERENARVGGWGNNKKNWEYRLF